MSKAVLAFSGGLDTSFAVPYLHERGYEVITATVDTGGFNQEELAGIAAQSKRLGASKHVEVDGREAMFTDVASYVLKTNGLYEGAYPNMCSDRYVIAAEAAKIAAHEGAEAIAHGSSAMGNDQVRFDLALGAVAPDKEIIAPIRDTGGNRERQQAALRELGIPIDARNKKYSVNQNILGITYSGSEIDDFEEPDDEMFEWTQPTAKNDEYVNVDFESGVPIGLDGQQLEGHEILSRMNRIAGSHGFGRGYYTGDCVIGIKGRIAFEAPGILALMQGHVALEQLVHTKAQNVLGKLASEHFTELVYNGKYFDPAVADLKSMIDSQQQLVTGSVTLRLSPNQVQAVAVDSPNSLVRPEVAQYAQSSSWTPQDAEGFIRLYGLQGGIAAARDTERRS